MRQRHWDWFWDTWLVFSALVLCAMCILGVAAAGSGIVQIIFGVVAFLCLRLAIRVIIGEV